MCRFVNFIVICTVLFLSVFVSANVLPASSSPHLSVVRLDVGSTLEAKNAPVQSLAAALKQYPYADQFRIIWYEHFFDATALYDRRKHTLRLRSVSWTLESKGWISKFQAIYVHVTDQALLRLDKKARRPIYRRMEVPTATFTMLPR